MLWTSDVFCRFDVLIGSGGAVTTHELKAGGICSSAARAVKMQKHKHRTRKMSDADRKSPAMKPVIVKIPVPSMLKTINVGTCKVRIANRGRNLGCKQIDGNRRKTSPGFTCEEFRMSPTASTKNGSHLPVASLTLLPPYFSSTRAISCSRPKKVRLDPCIASDPLETRCGEMQDWQFTNR
jgi:hypothetical protein